MKYLPVLIVFVISIACRKPQLSETMGSGLPVPWKDSSALHPKNNALNGLLEKYKRQGMPGISLLVNDDYGTWIGAAGKADLDNNIDFVPGTVSKAASITKLFIGTLLFKLMEDSLHSGLGYNSLHTRIANWLSQDIVDHLPNGNLVTLAQCMNHETGIPDVIEQDAFYLAVLNNPVKVWQPRQLLEFIYNKDPLFAPGDTAIYSNTNTILIKMIIENVTGKSHADLLKQYIFEPLDLHQTYYQPYDMLPNNTAQGYFDLYNNNSLVNVSNLVTGSGNGYGGLYSNVFDLFKFINALLIQKTFLDPSSLSIMTTFSGRQDGSNYYGYGIQKSFLDHGNDFGIGHKGRDLGYTANLFYFPAKRVTHIFFINYGTDSKSNLREVFEQFQEELIRITVD